MNPPLSGDRAVSELLFFLLNNIETFNKTFNKKITHHAGFLKLINIINRIQF